MAAEQAPPLRFDSPVSQEMQTIRESLHRILERVCDSRANKFTDPPLAASPEPAVASGALREDGTQPGHPAPRLRGGGSNGASGNGWLNEASRDLARVCTEFDQLIARQQQAEEDLRVMQEVAQSNLEAARVAEEELRVAGEELEAQNEQLLAARDTLEQERARYQDLFAFAPDAYLVTDEYGVVLEANQTASELLNLKSTRLAGKPLAVFIHPSQRIEFRHALTQAFRSHRCECEFKIEPRSGEPRIAAMSVGAISRECGSPPRLRWMIRDITEQKQAEETRRDLLHRLITAQEDEQRRLSRELHDQMGQRVTALQLGMYALRTGGTLTPSQEDALKNLQEIVHDLGLETHELAIQLRPLALDDLGLEVALAEYLETWTGRTGVTMDLHVRGLENSEMPSPIATAVYRIVQEALTNVVKHARATSVSVLIERSNRYLKLVIEDDGCGFEVVEGANGPAVKGRLGLVGMTERLAPFGGSLKIESSSGAGTTIYATIPLPPTS